MTAHARVEPPGRRPPGAPSRALRPRRRASALRHRPGRLPTPLALPGRAARWTLAAALLALGCGGCEPDVEPAVTAARCRARIAAFSDATFGLVEDTRIQRGTFTASGRDEDGESLGELRGELTTYRAPGRFRVELRLVDDEGDELIATDGVEGEDAWGHDPEIGVRPLAGDDPPELALERDLFGVPSFESLELDEPRLGSGQLAAEDACPVSGVTASGLEVEGRLTRGDRELILEGTFPTFFGPLPARVRLAGFRDVCDGAARGASRTRVTTTEIVEVTQRFELDTVDCGAGEDDLPGFKPPG